MHFHIHIYCPEKMPSCYRKAIFEYEKRLGRYTKISLHLIRKEKDWEKKLAEAEEGLYLTTGTSRGSEEFSSQIGRWESTGRKEVHFYVDRLYREEIPSDQLAAFSISRFQMNESMTALILYEQVYRAYRILHNHPYHK